MNEQKENTNTSNQQSEENNLYYYYGSDGQKYHTSNSSFAVARAEYHETYNVYVEKH